MREEKPTAGGCQRGKTGRNTYELFLAGREVAGGHRGDRGRKTDTLCKKGKKGKNKKDPGGGNRMKKEGYAA